MTLPSDRPRRLTQTFSRDVTPLTLAGDWGDRLRDIARTNDTTLTAVLLAAFQTLMHRYSGQTDVLVGCAIPEAVATLTRTTDHWVAVPMRADLSDDPSFRDLLSHAHTAVAMSAEPSSSSASRSGDVAGGPGASHTSLLRVAVGLRSDRREGAGGDVPTVRYLDNPLAAPRFDLVAWVEDTAAGLGGIVEYNAELFDRSTAARMSRHFSQLLVAIASNPDCAVSAMPLGSEDETRDVLAMSSGELIDRSSAPYLHHRFHEMAEHTPLAPAIVTADRTLTYEETRARARAFARRLRKHGVGPEVVVAIWAERTPDVIVAILGVLEAGGAYVPLDPTLPLARLRAMIADCRPAVLVTASAIDPAILTADLTVLPLEGEAAELDGYDQLADGLTPANAAYVIYTSGSNGVPNGVIITHSGLHNTITAATALYQITPDRPVLQAASLGFDASVLEIFLALSNGAPLIMCDELERVSGPDLERFLRAHRIGFATFTPLLLATIDPARVPDLTVVAVGGENCLPELPRRWSAGRRFVNAYGPTEASIFASRHICREDHDGTPPIGTPLPNTRVLLLDTNRRPVPVGIVGEIYIGGAGVGRGYVNRPALTAERFVPDPFDTSDTARLYRTGDLARRMPDGNVVFLGRADRQVKVRGFRIELGDVEHALRGHPAMAAAIVRPRQPDGIVRLVAYYVPRPGCGRPALAEVREFLRLVLPEYMCPTSLVALDRFPVTPNGKLDESALPDPDAMSASPVPLAPRTDRERQIASAFEEVLGQSGGIGVHDSFFDLGGHSLLAAELASLLRTRLGTPVPLRLLFEHPTVAGIATALAAGPSERSGAR